MNTTQPIHDDLRSVTVFMPHHPFTVGEDGSPVNPARPKWWRRIAFVWGVSGGTILSIVGFVALALYQQYADSLTELRNDLKHFNQTAAEFVKKDSLRNRFTVVMGSIKDLQAAHLNSSKEIQAVNLADTAREARLAQLERQVKTADEERRELVRELQRLRERLASVEGRQAAAGGVAPAGRSEK